MKKTVKEYRAETLQVSFGDSKVSVHPTYSKYDIDNDRVDNVPRIKISLSLASISSEKHYTRRIPKSVADAEKLWKEERDKAELATEHSKRHTYKPSRKGVAAFKYQQAFVDDLHYAVATKIRALVVRADKEAARIIREETAKVINKYNGGE